MPELPEVETVVRRLQASLIGRIFVDVAVHWMRMVQVPVADLRARLPGQQIRKIDRRGKYIVLQLSDGDTLIFHLKMTGDLRIWPESAPPHQHDRVVFGLDDGSQLRFRDMRKFGRVYLTHDSSSVLGLLGPEPLDDAFTEDDFLSLFDGRSGRIKPLLLNQQFIAGLGNIYADEALFLAGIQPHRRVGTLSEQDMRGLYRAIRRVLVTAIEKKGSSLADDTYWGGQYQQQFLVYGREELPCTKCGNPVRRIRLGQRSAHYCMYCQQ